MARIVRITWEKILVRQSERYGLTGEPGDSAEWVLFMEVYINGVQRKLGRWRHDDVHDNSTYTVDRRIDVALDGALSIHVGGFEKDSTSADDKIEGFDRNHKPEPGWESGGPRYEKTVLADSFEYTVYYTIQFISEGATITPGHGTLYDVRYSGLWDASQERTVWSTGLSAAEVNKQASQLWAQGGRLAQLQPYVLGNVVRYNVIWTFSGIRQLWSIDCDEAYFRKTTDENWSWSRPQQVIPFVVNGQVRYACLWNEARHGQLWNPNTDEAGFRTITGESWSWARPHQVYAFVVGGQLRYSCLWNAGQHAQLWHPNCSEADLRKLADDNWNWGRAHQTQPFSVGGQRRYSLLWNAGQHGQLWNLNCDQRQLEKNAADSDDRLRVRQILAPSQ